MGGKKKKAAKKAGGDDDEMDPAEVALILGAQVESLKQRLVHE